MKKENRNDINQKRLNFKFEQNNNTEVVIVWTKEKSNGDEVIPARRYAYFVLDGKKVKASVNKVITKEEESKKELLAISSCRGQKDETFWLIHKKNKITILPPEPVNIELLNNELPMVRQGDCSNMRSRKVRSPPTSGRGTASYVAAEASA